MTGPNVKEAIEDLDIELISLGEVAGAAINIKKLSFHQNICEAGMTWYPTKYLIYTTFYKPKKLVPQKVMISEIFGPHTTLKSKMNANCLVLLELW